MHFAATERPTTIVPIGMPRDPCPENSTWAPCAVCLPINFKNTESTLLTKPLHSSLSCRCTDGCPPRTFEARRGVCIPKEIYKFRIQAKPIPCTGRRRPPEFKPPSTDDEKDIPRHTKSILVAGGIGMVAFAILLSTIRR